MKKLISMLLIVTLIVLAGCSKAEPEVTTDTTVGETTETETTAENTATTDTEAGTTTETPEPKAPASADDLDYVTGLDTNGFFEGVNSGDYVELFDYNHMTIPADIHVITDDVLATELDGLLNYFATQEDVTDRAVVDGDTLNIDYVGSIDGVEFEGGNTQGGGAEVTIGVTPYIDDFLEQLIGHTPGENFDIEVTFPENYGKEELNGKDAVFNITINSISEKVIPELTDAFVEENLSAIYDWKTVEDVKAGIRKDLQDMAIRTYIQTSVVDMAVVSEVPEAVMTYQKASMKNYYVGAAISYGMPLDDFLVNFAGFESIEAIYEDSMDELTDISKYAMILQSIAKELNLEVTEDVITEYFMDINETGDYSAYEAQYGLEYLKYTIMQDMVLEHIIENAELL